MGQGSTEVQTRSLMCASIPPTNLWKPHPFGTLGGQGIQRDERLDHPAASRYVLVRWRFQEA